MSAILSAEGAAAARLRAAEAEAEAIQRIGEAMAQQAESAQYLITQRYIESFKEMARGNNTKVIFMPMETSAMLSSVGAIKEMFAETGERNARKEERNNPPSPLQLPT
jgi:regulator of protease activity HflC (stomatin/prohibitin superfamily)